MSRVQRHLECARIEGGESRRDDTAGRRILRCESGSALVEMALSAGLILCIFFAVIEFGFALYSYQDVNEIARDLTRYAIVRGSQCGGGMPNCGFTTSSTLQTYAQSAYTYPGIDTSKLTVTVTWYSPSTYAEKNPTWSTCSGSGCNAPGNMVQVTVQYPFLLSIPFWNATTLNVRSTSAMVISQ